MVRKAPLLCGLFALIFVLSFRPINSHATILLPNQTLRADFDLSGLTPTGPYQSLQLQVSFLSNLSTNESVSATIFDTDGGPSIGETLVVNNFGFPVSILGFGNILSPPALGDGIGVALLVFSQQVDVSGILAFGVTSLSPFVSTPPVDATLSVLSVPEPATLAIFAFGLAGLGFMGWRRKGKATG